VTRHAGSVTIAVAALLSACAAAPEPPFDPAPADGPCVPMAGVIGEGTTLDGRAGVYRLEMINEDGERRTAGTLTLVAQLDSMRTVGEATSTLYGSTTARPADVGAPAVGGLESLDPAAPGVLVLEGNGDGGRSVLLRLGSGLNRRDVTYFDAASVVLEVRHVDADGFAGNWRGEVSTRSTRGHFCAVR
jgi:hypothetical protein